jgi:hypothetical protein
LIAKKEKRRRRSRGKKAAQDIVLNTTEYHGHFMPRPEPESVDCIWENNVKDFEGIASKIQPGAHYWVNPDDNITYILGVTKSADEVAGMFGQLTFPDLHWGHWGGMDRKLYYNYRWYHITVGYGSSHVRTSRFTIFGRVNYYITVRDNTQPPQWIKIQCDPHAPGSADHLFKDHLGIQ